MSTHGPALSAGESGSVAGLVLVDLALVLLTAFLFAALAKRVRQPAVMGEIVAGVALGPSLLGLLPGDLPRLVFPPEVRPYLETLAQLGLVLFMFGVGYQLSLSHVRGVGKHIALVSFSSVALPFAMGAALAPLLYPWLDQDELTTRGVLAPALFLGAAMSITAFPVLARIITERGLQKQRVGTVALVSAAIQDVIAWSVLAAVVAMVTVSGLWSFGRTVGGAVLFVLVLVLVVRPALAWLLAPGRRWAGASTTVHVVLCAGLLTSAWITHELGLHAVFGAFLFGAVAPRGHIDATAPEVPERIEQTSLLLLPVFFTVTGLSVDLAGLGAQGLVMVLAIVAVACVGKFLGAAGAARLTGATGRESTVLGILLNARGLTELVVLNVGLSLGALDTRLFTAMVVMALVTTLMTGPLLTRFHTGAEPAPPAARRPVKHAGEGAVR
ncbi:cation:proton antiporter [Streptomyces fradiae]|uniref:cation:proton antiporter n=1 Tax=Streptomyces fradiae TaxID=1906 RepID=UPI002943EBC6|nr:cation:proton antiporter [Streptomyces fradiae]WOI61595.1 cation:proton antiporter [Streptomyces fradiae]